MAPKRVQPKRKSQKVSNPCDWPEEKLAKFEKCLANYVEKKRKLEITKPKRKMNTQLKVKKRPRVKSSTKVPSLKLSNFVNEPMGIKPVSAVTGIGYVYGERLCQKGYDKAVYLLGAFLSLKKDKKSFKEFLVKVAGVAPKCAEAAAVCLDSWSKNFLEA